jgi:hypothetical protein
MTLTFIKVEKGQLALAVWTHSAMYLYSKAFSVILKGGLSDCLWKTKANGPSGTSLAR